MRDRGSITRARALPGRRAAIPVAKLLGDFYENHNAHDCLLQMGPAAEEGLLKVVYSSDPRVCLAAIDLMADIGTAKSLPALQTALRSRNVNVREAAKEATRRIHQRQKEQEDKPQEGDEKGKASS